MIAHIDDGDECLKHGLLVPALSSYVHAIEWAGIAYLKYTQDIDIIEREQNGESYYFANGKENSILSEVKKHADLDQKTVSRLRSMNSAERRWMAHHKSGSVTEDEVKAVRSRLAAFVESLF